MDSSSPKIPPHNIEAEQSLLGSLLIDKDAILKVGDVVNTEDFYRDSHGYVYDAMVELYSKREPIDLLSLSNRLIEKKQLELIGGRAYLVSLTNTVPTASHVLHYAQIVHKKATLRRLISAAAEMSEMAYNETETEVELLLDKSEQRLFSISQRHLKQAFIPINSILIEAFDRIDEIHREKGKLRGIPTGFHDLDSLLAGLQKSDLIILAARPSVGKTSLALNFAQHIAVNAKVPVGIFTLEMSRDQIVDRLLCSQGEVDLWKMRTGRLSEQADDFPRIGHAMGVLSEAPIFIDDSSTANVMEIRTKARRLQMEHGLGFLIVDYLQLMEGRVNNPDNRVQEVAEITRGLKSIARELNIPVLALSQLNRSVEMRSPAIPKLADLRESGSIEQDADVVMFIYRKKMDRSLRNLPQEEENIAEIYIDKHRNGPTGMVRLYFNERCSNFKTVERSHRETEVIPVPV
jgi:replicative DNA helicase